MENLNPISITAIAGETKPSSGEFPMVPENVSFYFNEETNELSGNITVYIDVNNKNTPTFGVDASDNTQFYVQYNYAEEPAADVTEWTISFSGFANSGLKIGDEVTIFLEDLDPKTSRGAIVTIKPPSNM